MLGTSQSTPGLRAGSAKRLSSGRLPSSSPRRSDLPMSPKASSMEDKKASRFSFPSRLSASPRTYPTVSTNLQTASSQAGHSLDSLSTSKCASAPIDMIGLLESLLADEDSVRMLLRTKLTAGKFDYKGRIAELLDLTEELKGALSQQAANIKEVVTCFVPVQVEVNTRLSLAAEETATYRNAEQQLSAELAVAREQVTQNDRRMSELQEALEEARRERGQAVSEYTQRMESFEAASRRELAQVVAEFQRQIAVLEEREKPTMEQLATAAALEKELLIEAAAKDSRLRECAGKAQDQEETIRNLEVRLSQTEQSLQAAGADLKLSCQKLSDRECELESQLADKDSCLQLLKDGMSERQRVLLEVQAAYAQQKARETDLETRLHELEDLVKQKDDDVRKSLQSFKQMHDDNNKQLDSERQRLQCLESELQTLRMSEAELQKSLQERDQSLLRLGAEFASLQQEIASECKRIGESDAQQSAQQEELAQLQAKLGQVEKEKLMHEMEYASYKEHNPSNSLEHLNVLTDLKLTVDKLSRMGSGQHDGVTSEYASVLEQRLAAAEQSRREIHNALQELKGSIRVFCRVRPVLDGASSALEAVDGERLSLNCGGELYSFNFDKVFDTTSTQAGVFSEVSGLVQSALDGYKVCIFAYGQTGSGKTHTMQGPDPSSSMGGLIPRSLHQIFESSRAMNAQGWTWSLQVSFLEVYNESFRDLLTSSSTSSGNTAPPVHIVKHDEVWGSIVTNMTVVDVGSLEQLDDIMARASRQRSVGATDINAVSSRSHAVFALYLKGTNPKLGSELHGALHLVDLAGSERLDKSGSTGDRLKEAQNINRSLFCLVDVFLAKSERRSHVPFRNSKLTHLMEPCLSGQGKTLMVVNASPEDSNAPETLCSLRFGSQVNQCNTGGKAKRSAKSIRETNASPSEASRSSPMGLRSRTSGSVEQRPLEKSPRHSPQRSSPRTEHASVSRMFSAPSRIQPALQSANRFRS